MKYKINATILLMIFTILTNILSFGKNIIIANIFGTSSELDVYILALFIPTLLSGLLMGSLQSTLVPLTLEHIKEYGEENAYKWYKTIGLLTIVLLGIISICLVISNEWIYKYLHIGFSKGSLLLFYDLNDILMIMIVLNGLIILLKNLYYIKQEYILPSVSSFIGAILSILYLIWKSKPDSYTLCYSLIIGSTVDIIILFLFLKKYDIDIPKGFRLKNLGLKKFFGLMAPLLISASLGHANPLIDQIMASNMYEGAVSSLNYADKLNSMLVQIFVMTISTTALSSFSILVTENKLVEVREYFHKILRVYSMVLFPIIGFILLFGKHIVYILFERGQFTETSTILTADAWKFYSLGLMFMLVGTITARIYNALKNARIQMFISLLGLAINIFGNYIALKYIGHAGIALSTTITSLITTFLLVYFLQKYFIQIFDKKVFLDIIKILIINLIIFLGIDLLGIVEFFNKMQKMYLFFMIMLAFLICGSTAMFLYRLFGIQKRKIGGF
ncbi:lipid II flippase MurJ [Bacillus fungorum]|uniref:murein biosynthesis integral membrane protein MurJ n=1 Tax=Bacillus fungorum TaxID=2039284 RepID=UPI003396DC75